MVIFRGQHGPTSAAREGQAGWTDRQAGQTLVWPVFSLEAKDDEKRCQRASSIPLLRPPQRARARHVGRAEEAETPTRGGGAHLHRQRAATNRDGRSGSPRAFWGRIDRRAALWGAGPAASGGGTTAGAARRTSRLAGAASLPAAAVSSARLSDRACGRSGGLLGGLGGARGGETRSEGRRGAAAAAAATGLLTKDNDY